MEPRSRRKKPRKSRLSTVLLALAMIVGLGIGFFSAPYILKSINQTDFTVETGQTFFQNVKDSFNESYFGRGLNSLIDRIHFGPQEEEPVDLPDVLEEPKEETPKLPDIKEQPKEDEKKGVLLDFFEVEAWRLHLAFSQNLDWALEYIASVPSELPILAEEGATGAFLFFGPFAEAAEAEMNMAYAHELGFEDAYLSSWSLPRIELSISSEDEAQLTQAKTAAAFLKMAELILGENQDVFKRAVEMQNLEATKFAFGDSQEEEIWAKKLELLQALVENPKDPNKLKELISASLAYRVYFKALPAIS